MHPNPTFRGEPEESALEFARARSFGVFTISVQGSVLASHIPFVLEGMRVVAHMMRVNPIIQHLQDGPADALLLVSGPDGYVSPDWYGQPQLVPTWNYVAVHLRGELRLLEDTALREVLDRLSEVNEKRLAPKPPWKAEEIDSELLERTLQHIVPIEMSVQSVDSTFKLSQNRSHSARAGVAAVLAEGGTPGMETRKLAELIEEFRSRTEEE